MEPENVDCITGIVILILLFVAIGMLVLGHDTISTHAFCIFIGVCMGYGIAIQKSC